MSTSKQQEQQQQQQLKAQQGHQGFQRLSRVGPSWLLFLLFLLLSLLGDHQHWAASGSSIVEPEEAAFQGHCGHTSPCEQLCYEIHDGMYECDCIEGYELNKNGYSCQVINTTSSGSDGHGKSDEDVLYQKGASFSAKLANDRPDMAKTRFIGSASASDSNQDSSDSESESESESAADFDADNNSDSYDYNDDNLDRGRQQPQNVNSNDYYISAESISFNSENENQELDAPDFKVASTAETSTSTPRPTTTSTITTAATTVATKAAISTSIEAQPNMVDYEDDREVNGDVDEYYSYKSDMSIYDDVNNNQLNLRRNPNSNSNSHTYQMTNNNYNNSNRKNNNNKVVMHINKNAANSINIISEKPTTTPTTVTSSLCSLECGTEGICALEATSSVPRCLCPFGKTGNGCLEDIRAHVPRFAKRSWLAFAALHGAYKHVQLRLEFRPESFDGIILLSGERDDLTGDFMALLLNKGFVEFWFDCGSGVGSVRSRETILLNEWNSVIIYRHRWDAWMVLNHGTKVQGRSNGLFSRITFREPVFLGGIGNITGLAKRLPLAVGFSGCIRRFVANEHDYKFTEHPLGDVINGFDIQDCSTDKCVRYPCQHGGKCLPSDQGAVCLCPIGFVGDLCEIRMDLQVPAFNGSSFLRYAPLGNGALIWLELKVILKPEQSDGLILYSGPEHRGDFIALYLLDGFVEFAFDLGSGPAVVRSEYSLSLGQWHTIKISRTARLAVLKIDQYQEVMTISSNGFWHLSLAQNLFVGGVNHVDHLPLDLKYKSFFVGCIQRIDINGHSLGIVAEALGGSNIGNCPHACVARPCGPLAECVPQMESYECRCSIYNGRCNKAVEVPPELLPELSHHKTHNGKPLEGNKQHKGVDSTSSSSLLSSLPPALLPKKLWPHKKSATKRKNLHKHKTIAGTPTTQPTSTNGGATTTTTTTARPTTTTAPRSSSTTTTLAADKEGEGGALSSEEIEDDIIFRFVHENAGMQNDAQRSTSTEPQMQRQIQREKQQKQVGAMVKKQSTVLGGKQHVSKHEHYQKPNAFAHKLSRLPTHYESFQTNPDSDILTFDDNNDWVASLQQQEYEDAMATSQMAKAPSVSLNSADDDDEHNDNVDNVNYNLNVQPESGVDVDTDASGFVFDESLFDPSDGSEDYQRKQLAQDMERIMTNKHTNAHTTKQDHEQAQEQPRPVITKQQYSEDYSDDELLTPVLKTNSKPATASAPSTPQTHTDWSLLKKFDLSAEHQSQVQSVRKNFGACFAGTDSYFHYNDAETMSQVISYNIDLNLRIKTHSDNGIILWTGRQGTTEKHDDYLSLGIEKGYLHFRYDLGAGELNIRFNGTKVSDGLWHRVRAIRNSQEGYLEVDGRKTLTLRAPGKCRQLNTDTGLFVGGMPDVAYFTHQRYFSGIIGCISEIVLAGDKLNFDPNTLGTAHNVETGLL